MKRVTRTYLDEANAEAEAVAAVTGQAYRVWILGLMKAEPPLDSGK